MELQRDRAGHLRSNLRGAGALLRRRRLLGAGLLLMLACGGVVALSLGSMYYGMRLYEQQAHTDLNTFVKGLAAEKLSVIPHFVEGLVATPPEIRLDVEHVDYQRLAHNRKIAMERGQLFADQRDEVKASLSFAGRTHPAKIRLKGDLSDHWAHPYKWSLRAKLKGDATVFGMRSFSLQHPKTRRYLNEWVFHRLLEYNGLIALRYEFVDLTLNGKDLGLYAVEEHFDKRLIEHNRRREGPILRFQELLGDPDNYQTAPIDAFASSAIAGDPQYAAQFRAGKNLLEAFRQQKIGVAGAFDLRQMARFFALLELLGNHHASYDHNVRFYYNPLTSRLEPIGFDNQFIVDVSTTGLAIEAERSPWIERFMRDPDFVRAYVSALRELAEPGYVEEFLESVREEMDQKLALLYSEFPTYHFSTAALERNQQYIRQALEPRRSIQAYLARSPRPGEPVELQLLNLQGIPVRVGQLRRPDRSSLRPLRAVELEPRLRGRAPLVEDVGFVAWKGDGDPAFGDGLELEYSLVGTDEWHLVPVSPWTHLDAPLPDLDLARRPGNVLEREFATLDAVTAEIRIAPGTWPIRESVVVPAGYTLVAGPGTTLDLQQGANLISRSRLRFVGTPEEPVRIVSSDGAGRGLLVVDAGAASHLQDVRFERLANVVDGRWQLPAAVNFYQSPLECLRCAFVGNRAEGDDYLNVVRSTFEIRDSLFEQVASDAFDGDFTEGSVRNTAFVDVGNDAIDVSGSRIEIEQVVVRRSGDKGISVGEDSELSGSRVVIEDSEIAIASKDLSTVVLDDLRIRNCKIGFTAYQKKPEFGPGRIRISNLFEEGIQRLHILEDPSRIVIDGEALAANERRVESVLYGIEYGKASGGSAPQAAN